MTDAPAVTCTTTCARWLRALQVDDIPADVVDHAKLRLLDVIGVMLAASALEYGRVIRAAVLDLSGTGPSAIVGLGDRVMPVWSAFANGALAHALIFDDTHNETIVHPGGPVAGAALALVAAQPTTGAALLAALVGATEITCRLGLAAVGQFHKSGFQPTAIVGPPGAAFVASRLYGLGERAMVHAVGNSGSFASGINESWSDGTWTQLLHPGWAAHSGIAAAVLARAGWSGPAAVVEGRFGLFRSHVQQPGFAFTFDRVTRELGTQWESRHISFKPYPCAHVLHPFIDAILALRAEGLTAQAVERIDCPIADYQVPVVCEPVDTKRHPVSDAQARTSLPFSLAEALVTGRLDATSYSARALRDAEILSLAERIHHVPDTSAPDSKQYKGWVIATTRDGGRFERVEAFNRGSLENPLAPDDVRDKFRHNAATCLPSAQVATLERLVLALEQQSDTRSLLAACAGQRP